MHYEYRYRQRFHRPHMYNGSTFSGGSSPSMQGPDSSSRRRPPVRKRNNVPGERRTAIVVFLAVTLAILITAVVLLGFFLHQEISRNDRLTAASGSVNFPGTASRPGTFTPDMENPESQAFKDVQEDFCGKMDVVMRQSALSDIYVRCEVTKLSDGTVTVDYILIMKPKEEDDIPETYQVIQTVTQSNRVPLGALIVTFNGTPTRTYGADDCASSPCDNGAKCQDLENAYICKCAQGFYGVNCENAETCSQCPTCSQDGTCPLCPTCSQGGTCAKCPTCSQGGTCPTCPACSQGGTCPECPTCSQTGSCPSCPTCSQGGSCPACPTSAQGGTCPACPPCSQGGVCPTCPNTSPGATSPSCPSCAQGGTCPSCPTCPQGGACPACPTCSQGATCSSCPTSSQGGACPSCPTCSQGATCAPCPNCVPVTSCPSCAPCSQGGTCPTSSPCPTCSGNDSCPAPATTQAPDPEPDYCAGAPCQNGGTCFNSTGTHHCNCDKNWKGDDCTEVYCLEGFAFTGTGCEKCPVGSYKPTEGNTNCTSCPEGSTTVETGAVNEHHCSLCKERYGPTQNACVECPVGKYNNATGRQGCADCPAGTFTDVTGQNECAACSAGTYAPGAGATNCKNCSGDVLSQGADCDECGSDPCQHGGSCTDGDEAYTCACAPGYTGTHCEINIDECASDPCQNTGTCVDGINSFTCNCLLLLKGNGDLCENDCIDREDYWCEPAGWTAGQPNLYFPFESTDNFTAMNESEPQAEEVGDQESVLVDGVVGRAVHTTDTQYIDLGNIANKTCYTQLQNCTNGISFAFWFFYYSCCDTGSLIGSLEKSPKVFCFDRTLIVTAVASGVWEVPLLERINTGTWVHAAVVLDGSPTGEAQLYINGDQVMLQDKFSPANNTIEEIAEADNLVLGKTYDFTQLRSLDFSMDELLFFDKVLTSEQIKQIYDASAKALN